MYYYKSMYFSQHMLVILDLRENSYNSVSSCTTVITPIIARSEGYIHPEIQTGKVSCVIAVE